LGRSERWWVLLGAVLLAAVIAYAASRNALADYWEQSDNPADWFRAAQLEPDNADYWYRLGRYRQFDFAAADLSQAISYYRRAVALNPHSAGYWMDLASAYEATGQNEQALAAFERAKASHPISADVAWRYGNFLLRAGNVPEAFVEIRHAVETNPKLLSLAVTTAWQATQDIQRVLSGIIPTTSGACLDAVDALAADHEAAPALVVWNRMIALGQPFELRRALPLVEELVLQDQEKEAWQVWRQALTGSGNKAPDAETGERITDGGFESDPPQGGFGWHLDPMEGADYAVDDATRHSGGRALRVRFDGSANFDFRQVWQLVFVEPNRQYRFSAYVRVQGISTESGLRFFIRSPRPSGFTEIETTNLLGTQPWSLQQVDFTTGPQTRLLEIVLRREPSRKLDNKLRGTVWVDDVSLVPLGASREQLP
jgi:hypothetical protein